MSENFAKMSLEELKSSCSRLEMELTNAQRCLRLERERALDAKKVERSRKYCNQIEANLVKAQWFLRMKTMSHMKHHART